MRFITVFLTPGALLINFIRIIFISKNFVSKKCKNENYCNAHNTMQITKKLLNYCKRCNNGYCANTLVSNAISALPTSLAGAYIAVFIIWCTCHICQLLLLNNLLLHTNSRLYDSQMISVQARLKMEPALLRKFIRFEIGKIFFSSNTYYLLTLANITSFGSNQGRPWNIWSMFIKGGH